MAASATGHMLEWAVVDSDLALYTSREQAELAALAAPPWAGTLVQTSKGHRLSWKQLTTFLLGASGGIITKWLKQAVIGSNCTNSMPAPLAHSVKDAQELFDHFVTSAHCFGLKGSLKKTEIMPQLVWKEPSTPVITAAGAVLKAVDKFCYLGGVLSPSSNVDYDIFTRLAKASAAFGNTYGTTMLSNSIPRLGFIRQWSWISCCMARSHGQYIVAMFWSAISSTCCLRKTAHVNWWDKIPSTEVLKLCGVMGMEAMLTNKQFHWIGHVVRLDDTWIPKMVLYGQLVHRKRSIGGQCKHYKDILKANVESCSISPNDLETLVQDRLSWQQTTA